MTTTTDSSVKNGRKKSSTRLLVLDLNRFHLRGWYRPSSTVLNHTAESSMTDRTFYQALSTLNIFQPLVFALRACTAMTGSTCVFRPSSLLPFPFHSAICALTVPLRPVFIGTRRSCLNDVVLCILRMTVSEFSSFHGLRQMSLSRNHVPPNVSVLPSPGHPS